MIKNTDKIFGLAEENDGNPFYIGFPEDDFDKDVKELVDAMLKITAKKMASTDPQFQDMDAENIEVVLRKLLKLGLARFVVSPDKQIVNFEIHPDKKFDY